MPLRGSLILGVSKPEECMLFPRHNLYSDSCSYGALSCCQVTVWKAECFRSFDTIFAIQYLRVLRWCNIPFKEKCPIIQFGHTPSRTKSLNWRVSIPVFFLYSFPLMIMEFTPKIGWFVDYKIHDQRQSLCIWQIGVCLSV